MLIVLDLMSTNSGYQCFKDIIQSTHVLKDVHPRQDVLFLRFLTKLLQEDVIFTDKLAQTMHGLTLDWITMPLFHPHRKLSHIFTKLMLFAMKVKMLRRELPCPQRVSTLWILVLKDVHPRQDARRLLSSTKLMQEDVIYIMHPAIVMLCHTQDFKITCLTKLIGSFKLMLTV
jgi:hypothetical protein